jgi:2-methylisocitrate lyase-like PEP mutase family enzyme
MTTKLRDELEEGIVVEVAVTDPLIARLVESLGFKCLMLTGSALGWVTCKPEPLSTADDYIRAARPIVDSVNIPLFVDGCTGFGDAAHTAFSVKQYAKAGTAGMFIEDQVYPKRMGYWGPEAHAYKRTKYVISTEEMVTKIKAALKMRDEIDRDFVLFARTDAFGAVGGGLDEAIARCKAYWDAGVDGVMVFPSEEPTLELLTEARRKLAPPVRIDGGLISSKFSLQDYERMGFNTCGLHNQTTVVAFEAVKEFLSEVKNAERLPERYNKFMVGARKAINELVGLPSLWEIEKEQEESIGLPKNTWKP